MRMETLLLTASIDRIISGNFPTERKVIPWKSQPVAEVKLAFVNHRLRTAEVSTIDFYSGSSISVVTEPTIVWLAQSPRKY